MYYGKLGGSIAGNFHDDHLRGVERLLCTRLSERRTTECADGAMKI